jgi:uncharacterized SAM-binding protein YcdF (DUF218 family)
LNPASDISRSPGRFGWFVRRLVQRVGILTLLWMGLCLSPLPMEAYKWLGKAPIIPNPEAPDVIVVLGGGGIPSESGLIRCYEGAVAAREYPHARVIVSLPADEDTETSSVGRMRDELAMRGVDRDRIGLESRARNTREQALRVAEMLADTELRRVMVITSEYHVRRSVLAFRRAGLPTVGRKAAVIGPEADMGSNLRLRYAFWHNLSNGVNLARELVALAVYKARGWI